MNAFVEKVDSLRAKETESERVLDNLSNSLVQMAFKGELVRQKASDPLPFDMPNDTSCAVQDSAARLE